MIFLSVIGNEKIDRFPISNIKENWLLNSSLFSTISSLRIKDLSMENSLKATLEACHKVAEKGYKIAEKNNNALKTIIKSSEEKLGLIKDGLLQQEIKIPEYYQEFIGQTEENISKLNT